MIIKQIKLHNIRSYLDETIKFPTGSTLLSGDIGSGKSTILLSIEFALFGLQRGIVDGSSLLRNGLDEGYIELDFTVAERAITITRSLKRNKKAKTVNQSSASIVIDSQKKELTVTELKSFILDVLNYPASLLTKRNFIYRHTVYCPQEEMKKIIFESAEERLDTLRKVFDIDKYKRILNNSELFVSQLKEKKKEKEGQLSDLPFKKIQLKNKNESLAALKKKVQDITPLLFKSQQDVSHLRAKIKEKQEAVEKLFQARAKVASFEAMISEKKIQVRNYENEEVELENAIKKLKIELKDFSLEKEQELKKEIAQIKLEIQTGRNNEKIFERELASLETKKESFLRNSEKISSLKAVCPVCEQDIPDEHKEKIISKLKPDIEKIELEESKKNNFLNELKVDLGKLDCRLNELAEKEKAMSFLSYNLKNLDEKQKKKAKITGCVAEIKENLFKIEQEKKTTAVLIEQHKNIEMQFKEIQGQFEQKQKEEKVLLIEKAGLDQSLKDTEEEIIELDKEIEKKEKITLSLKKLEELQNFLTKNFTCLIELMEKHVMLRLNREFNVLFRQWFIALVEDPGIEASVDVDFSPLIEQAGYEINYRYLSGGEKTALALAYRLALNQVINSMLSKLNTKSLLILDEPTDGFSAEQLNKMRNVLQELKTEQLILVSHETKIESFVEHVIHFVKQSHVSRIN